MLPKRSDRRIYLRVLGPLLLAIGTLVAMSVGGFHALSGARAFVGGESLWSKASSRTVAQLRLRASGGLAVCPALDEALAVPLGDRAARLALEQSPPDLEAARRGFLRGGNLPADIEDMVRLYLDFGATPLLREPVEAWRRGDALIERLRTVGERLCAGPPLASAGTRETGAVRELDQLDDELIEAEKRFSVSLGHASLVTGELLTAAVVLIALLLAGGSAWYVLRSLRAQLAQRAELGEANSRWNLAADAAGIGLFVWNPATDDVQLDPRACRLYGVASDARLTSADLRALMHPGDRDSFEQLRQSTITAGEALRASYRIVRSDGSTRHIAAIGMLRGGDRLEGPRQMFGVLRDVTDEIAAARLQLERDAAERSAQARSEFLSRLSHELRTPLNAVLGLAQLMEIDQAEPLTNAQAERVRQILASGWHLLHLVDDVLDITRIDSGQLAIRSVPTDPRAVLRASLALVEPERARLGIRIVDRWPVSPARVMADPQRLQQVLVNLLSNACKYNRPGGTLTLGCAETPDEVCLSVADEGAGIEAAQLAELFQPFKRLAQTAELPGTGLGLVVVKLLTEQMRGRIEIDSAPGRGSRFVVWLRRAPALHEVTVDI